MSDSIAGSRRKVARIVTQRLEDLQRAGVSHLPRLRRDPIADAVAMAGERTLSSGAGRTQVAASPRNGPAGPAAGMTIQSTGGIVERSLFDAASQAPIVPPAHRSALLKTLQDEVAGCTRCQALCSTRTQTVFGVGSPNAKICFFGEAPGADEDRLGEPFVGRAGQLLTKMIQACGLKREDIYILNVLKCRPPENRNPLPDETANCRGFFERQLEIIRPEIICCLGAVAAQALLSTDRAIGKLRKQWHDYRGTAVICTYHPAYLLRNPAAKSDAWEDLKMMMRRIGVEL